MVARVEGESFVWIDDTSHDERKTLFASFAGYATDAFDFIVYTLLIPTLIAVYGACRWWRRDSSRLSRW